MACWSKSVWPLCRFDRSICLFVCPLCRSQLSCNLFVVKQIGYNIFMSFNVNNWPLAPQSEEISSDSNRDVSTDQHSTRAVKKRWLGGDREHLKGLETWDGWLISSNKHCFCFYTCILFKTLILLFKSFHEFFWHHSTFFSSYKLFLIIPYPPAHVKLQSCCKCMQA